MDEMNACELLVKEAKNSALKDAVMAIKESNSLEEAEAKVKALLNK